MAIRITAIHLEGGSGHEHIATLKWTNPANQKTGTNTRRQIVGWIENENGKAYVEDSQRHRVEVRVVTPRYGEKYLRTYADGYPTDNLLSLPRF